MFSHSAILCLHLADPVYGQIFYESDIVAPFDLNTTAYYLCIPGFSLTEGDPLRTCEGDGTSVVGEWSGMAPDCGGESRGKIKC